MQFPMFDIFRLWRYFFPRNLCKTSDFPAKKSIQSLRYYKTLNFLAL